MEHGPKRFSTIPQIWLMNQESMVHCKFVHNNDNQAGNFAEIYFGWKLSDEENRLFWI